MATASDPRIDNLYRDTKGANPLMIVNLTCFTGRTVGGRMNEHDCSPDSESSKSACEFYVKKYQESEKDQKQEECHRSID